jgi:hypothetical protein
LLSVLAGGCQQTVMFLNADAGGGDSLSGLPGDICNGGQKVISLYYTPEKPEVILALDRSNSMTTSSFGSTSELGAAIDALDAIVGKYYQLVNFDYIEFPGYDFNCQQNMCCAGRVTSIPNPNAFQYARCDASGPGCPMSDQRPLGAALMACESYYSQPGPPGGGGKRYVLVVTGGPPTCSSPSSGSCPEHTVAGDLRGAPAYVETAVVVLGSVSDDQCLYDSAAAGGFSNGPPFYYSATTPEGLAATIDTMIVRQMAENNTCTLDLGGAPDNPDQVVLLLNNNVVMKGDGWTYADSSHTHITLSPSTCDQYLDNPGGLGLLGCANMHH